MPIVNFGGISRRPFLAFCSAFCVLLCSGSGKTKATFTTFDDGAVASVNSAGEVTGWKTDGTSFMRTMDGTVTIFAVPGATQTEASSINDAGVTVGFYRESSGKVHGFLRANDGNITGFDVRGASGTGATDVNNNGEIAGTYDDNTGTHAFVRATSGRIRTFDPPGSAFTTAACLNDRGVVVGSFSDSEHHSHGYLRTKGGTITVFDVPAAENQTNAECINIKGVIDGYYFAGDGWHGFIRAPDGSMTTFDEADCDVFPAAINRKDVITGWCQDRANPSHVVGFMRRPNGAIRKFHVPDGGTKTFPVAINDSGVIAGNYNFGGFLRFP